MSHAAEIAEYHAWYDLQFPQEEHIREATKKVLTNADHIHSMTDEELAEWLDEELGCCCYCSEEKRLENEPLLRGEKCDEQCKKHLLDWLKQPYKEDT